MKMKEKETNQEIIVKKIKEVIDKLRPYLQNDGGDIQFKRFENGVVYVKLVGACSNCPMATMTLQDGIENALINEVPEVIKVVGEE
ncbi:MAG: NifU family protein [Bacilli bacterium]|nr:NifU family protein [Bacilli bacterium]MDY4996801.1 NifU family protein [Bacilli bacterium]